MDAQPIKDQGEKGEISTARLSVAEENPEAVLLLIYTSPDAGNCQTSYMQDSGFQPLIIL